MTVRRTTTGFAMGGEMQMLPPTRLSGRDIETWVMFWNRPAANDQVFA